MAVAGDPAYAAIICLILVVSVRRMNTKPTRASCSVRCLAQTPAGKHSVQLGIRTHIRGFAGADAAPQMAGPQLGKFPALLKEIRSQICPLHLVADLRVSSAYPL
jgi:hypothetical protein